MKNLIADGFVVVVKFMVIAVVWNFVLFNLGRATMLVVTLGRYPRGRALENDSNRVAVTGLIILVCVWSAIAIYNNVAHVGHPY